MEKIKDFLAKMLANIVHNYYNSMALISDKKGI